jgi:hypothetical protein
MQPDNDLKRLDETIARLASTHDAAPCDLLLEHLRAARRYKLGSMPGEYKFSLQQAIDAVYVITNESARIETKSILGSLIHSEVSQPQRSIVAGAAYALASPAPLAATT